MDKTRTWNSHNVDYKAYKYILYNFLNNKCELNDALNLKTLTNNKVYTLHAV